MGPKLYRVTIFFGPHVPNFLEAPSCLVLMFSDLQQPPTCCSHAPDASPEFKLHSVLSNSGQRCVDLSSMENSKLYNRVTIFFGPHVPNFLAKPSSNFFHYPCFTCYRTATWNLHFFCDTLLHPSMWITRVYRSLHVSEFTSPSSTFICHLAFVHPPPGPQVVR